MNVFSFALRLNSRRQTSAVALGSHPLAQCRRCRKQFFSCSAARPATADFKRYTMPSPATLNGAPSPRAPRTAYIALGSNLGDRIAWIERACNEMDKRGIHVKRTSSLWETEPMYVLDQDRFVNGACEVRSTRYAVLPSL